MPTVVDHARRTVLAAVSLAVPGLLLGIRPARAQSFPDRPVRIVVPFPPGGAVDALARVTAESLTQKWKQNVIVENRPGGNQIIGTQSIAAAAPDGLALLLATTGHAVNATLIEKLPYDPVKDFTAVALSATAPNILVVNPAVPADTLKEFIDYARSNPGKLNASHPGTGTTLHLGLEILKAATKTDFTIVGYKGTAPALNAVLAGEVDFMFDVTAAVPHVKAGKLKALAVTSSTRASLLPEVPTLAEAGLPDVEIFSWYAYLAPAGTPPAILAQLNRDIAEALGSPSVQGRLVGYGLEPAKRMGPKEVDDFIRQEIDRWAKVLKDAGVKGP